MQFSRLMWMRQKRSQAKKESKPCQHLSSIKTEKDLKTLLELIKTESEAPLQSTHEFAWMKISISNKPQNKFVILSWLLPWFSPTKVLLPTTCWQQKVHAWTVDLSIALQSMDFVKWFVPSSDRAKLPVKRFGDEGMTMKVCNWLFIPELQF